MHCARLPGNHAQGRASPSRAAMARSRDFSASLQSCAAALATPSTPRNSPSVSIGTASEPSMPVVFAAGRAWPEVSVCRLQSETGSRFCAARPAMPLPIGTVAMICVMGAGILRLAASFSIPLSASSQWTVPAWQPNARMDSSRTACVSRACSACSTGEGISICVLIAWIVGCEKVRGNIVRANFPLVTRLAPRNISMP